MKAVQRDRFAANLLGWYDQEARQLPWRRPEGQANPYHVWISEIMLQQTVVKTVIPYFERFIARFPTIADLAAVEEAELLTYWAGLGYYARGRNLRKAAQILVSENGGKLPKTVEDLKQLPGIGDYTAAAIAAIAYGEKVVAVDGNVERVTARLFDVTDALPGAKPKLRALAQTLAPKARNGDFVQSLMELGATVCRPRSPKCQQCPVSSFCRVYKAGKDPERYPVKPAKQQSPTRYGAALLLHSQRGALFFERRGGKGLLAGMDGVPLAISKVSIEEARQELAERFPSVKLGPSKADVRHTFTHFHLQTQVYMAEVCSETGGGFWLSSEKAKETLALPRLMKKILEISITEPCLL